MGADVMRWQFSAQPPDRNLLFGYGPAHEIKRRLLTFWNSAKFLVDYATIAGFEPDLGDLERGPVAADLRPLDRWLLARTRRLVGEATQSLEAQLTYRLIDAFEAYVDDLSNWYIRRSRPRFYGGSDEPAFRVLWHGLAQAVRVIAPVMPFLADHLWRNLVAEPESVFLAPWPEAGPEAGDDRVLAEMEEARLIAELGRRARDAANRKLRQPLRTLVVEGADLARAHADVIADELRVKEIAFRPIEGASLRAKPNLPLLGPKLGKELGSVRAALADGRFELLDGGRVRVDARELEPEEVFIERTAPEGWELAAENGLAVALDVRLDEELEREGRVYDLVRALQLLRKEAGLEVTDRIVATLPTDADIEGFEDRIREETLAVSLETGDALAVRKA
jgi:isoleucyl-tRNA synthetase